MPRYVYCNVNFPFPVGLPFLRFVQDSLVTETVTRIRGFAAGFSGLLPGVQPHLSWFSTNISIYCARHIKQGHVVQHLMHVDAADMDSYLPTLSELIYAQL